jgi:hypothetical protein
MNDIPSAEMILMSPSVKALFRGWSSVLVLIGCRVVLRGFVKGFLKSYLRGVEGSRADLRIGDIVEQILQRM